MSPRITSARSAPAVGRLEGDGGAAMVELALAIPILALLMLGVLEYGWAFRQNDLLERTLTSSGRAVGQQSNGRYGDYEALRAIQSGTSAMTRATITRVVIWKANTASSPPAACTPPTLDPAPTGTGGYGAAGVCNYYTPSEVADQGVGGFGSSGSSCSGAAYDRFWCPLSRNPDSPDKIGVMVDVAYPSLTRLFSGGSVTFRRQAIFQIEPVAVGS